MRLLTIIYVTDMAASVRFYEAIGLQRAGEVSDHWTEFAIGDATIALHWAMGEPLARPDRRIDLNFTVPADGTLERLLEQFRAEGIAIGGEIADQGFGRFFRVTDPDGLPVQFNEQAG